MEVSVYETGCDDMARRVDGLVTSNRLVEIEVIAYIGTSK